MPPPALPAPAQAVEPTVTVPQAMQLALTAYGRGDWLEAARLCRAVLDMDAAHFDALHLGGNIVGRQVAPMGQQACCKERRRAAPTTLSPIITGGSRSPT